MLFNFCFLIVDDKTPYTINRPPRQRVQKQRLLQKMKEFIGIFFPEWGMGYSGN
jgi:hypothetical protein